jgi:hypothetical protein
VPKRDESAILSANGSQGLKNLVSRAQKKSGLGKSYPPGNPAEPERIVDFFYLVMILQFTKVVFINYY